VLAEINHKFRSSLEDELTGNFFGTMRYMPFSRGLKIIFEKCIKTDDCQVKQIFQGVNQDKFKFDFWKCSDLKLGEIDAYMKLDNLSIGIEVKYNSGLSGDDQLVREAKMLQEWDKIGYKLLVFVGKKEDAKDVYIKHKDEVTAIGVHFAYMEWEEILKSLDYIKGENPFENIMIADIKDYLYEKGFDGFETFDNIGNTVISNDLFYKFEEDEFIAIPNLEVKGDMYYVFE
jgi:hypothetical protein